MTTLWKIVCQEDKYPGMWRRWFKNQCVAVGWPKERGYTLKGKSEGNSKGWSAARNAIKKMAIGDLVLVTLRGHRIGKIGEIVGKRIEDNEWDPLVPPGPQLPHGDKGRRILVRWELTTGPVELWCHILINALIDICLRRCYCVELWCHILINALIDICLRRCY